MKELMKRQTKAQRIMTIAGTVILAAILSYLIVTFAPGVYADGELNEGAKNIVGMVYRVLKYIAVIIGVVMFLSGVMGFVTSKQNDNGPEEHKAVAKMAVGVILTVLFTVIINENWAIDTINSLVK